MDVDGDRLSFLEATEYWEEIMKGGSPRSTCSRLARRTLKRGVLKSSMA